MVGSAFKCVGSRGRSIAVVINTESNPGEGMENGLRLIANPPWLRYVSHTPASPSAKSGKFFDEPLTRPAPPPTAPEITKRNK